MGFFCWPGGGILDVHVCALSLMSRTVRERRVRVCRRAAAVPVFMYVPHSLLSFSPLPSPACFVSFLL